MTWVQNLCNILSMCQSHGRSLPGVKLLSILEIVNKAGSLLMLHLKVSTGACTGQTPYVVVVVGAGGGGAKPLTIVRQ